MPSNVQDFELTVTPETLTAKAGEISSQRSNISNYMSQIQNIVQGLQNEIFSGESATTFHEKFNSEYQNVEHMLITIQGYIDDLTKSADIYTRAHATSKTAAEGLPTSGVFVNK